MDKHALALLRNKTLWKKMVRSEPSWHRDKLTAQSYLRVSSSWWVVPERVLAAPWKVPSETAEEQYQIFTTPFHLVDKIKAAPELISEGNVSVMLFKGIPPKNCNYGPIFSLAGEYFTHLGLTCMSRRFILKKFVLINVVMRPRDSLDDLDRCSLRPHRRYKYLG